MISYIRFQVKNTPRDKWSTIRNMILNQIALTAKKKKKEYLLSLIKNLQFRKARFWQFFIKPFIFWNLYYWLIFLKYYFLIICNLWLRFHYFIFIKNSTHIYSVVSDYMQIFFIFEQTNFYSKVKNYYYMTQIFINRFYTINSFGFFIIPSDFFHIYSSVQVSFLHKFLWRRRYKISYWYLNLLRSPLLQTYKLGGWVYIFSSFKQFQSFYQSFFKFSKIRKFFLK
jgi:hypothetical protein